jgi:hypothetical protein
VPETVNEQLTSPVTFLLSAAKEPSIGGAGKGQSIFKKANTMSSGLFAAAMAETDAEGKLSLTCCVVGVLCLYELQRTATPVLVKGNCCLHSGDSVVSCGGYCCALQLLRERAVSSVALVVNRLPTSVAVLAPSSRYLSFLTVILAAPDSDAEEVAEEGDPAKAIKPALTRSSTASTGELTYLLCIFHYACKAVTLQ